MRRCWSGWRAASAAPRFSRKSIPGSFSFALRAATGTRIEVTEQIAQKALEVIKEEAGPDNVEISVCFGGVSPSSYTINTVYLWTAGPEEVVMRVGLKEGSGIGVEAFKEKLRAAIPKQVGPWLRERLQESRRARG